MTHETWATTKCITFKALTIHKFTWDQLSVISFTDCLTLIALITWVLQPFSSLFCSTSSPWSMSRRLRDDHRTFISLTQAFKLQFTLTNMKDCSGPMSWKCVSVGNILPRMGNNAAAQWKSVCGDLNAAVRIITWNRRLDATARTMNGPVRHSSVLPWRESHVLRNHPSGKTLPHCRFARPI